tara:strand:- start:678 stop:2201 length:1524 start_codon:yes stop_codon:yes gene_type:complete
MSIYKDDLPNDEYETIIPDWYYRVEETLGYEWHGILNDNYKDYCFPKWPQNNFNAVSDESIKSFSLSYDFKRYLGPVRPYYENVTKDCIDELLSASIDDLYKYYLTLEYERRDERWNDDEYMLNFIRKREEERWNDYAKDRWIRIKNDAEKIKSSLDNIIIAQEKIYQESCDYYEDIRFSPTKMANHIFDLNPVPPFFKTSYNFNYDSTSKTLQIDFSFPDYRDEEIVIGKTARYDNKFASATAKRKIIKESLYSLIIWVGHVVSIGLENPDVEQIAINVHQSWFDPATGKGVNGVIASVLGATEYFGSLNIEKVDPIACMRQLKGITTPSLENQSPIRPIFDLNMDDKRVVDSKDIDGTLEEGENLAAMPWEDFEHLVAQLFEWEFAKDGAEVKVTQASRDRGVDAILFDPDPIRGGKYVLQAKRYTRTVDVASVRDLYGTVMNEGANRGILITTSSYGPDSYEFAKDKPISLVDGPNLIQMLRKHNKNYKIDLKEARDILGLDQL